MTYIVPQSEKKSRGPIRLAGWSVCVYPPLIEVGALINPAQKKPRNPKVARLIFKPDYFQLT
jgi:hypothetical protein